MCENSVRVQLLFATILCEEDAVKFLQKINIILYEKWCRNYIKLNYKNEVKCILAVEQENVS